MQTMSRKICDFYGVLNSIPQNTSSISGTLYIDFCKILRITLQNLQFDG